MKIISKLIDFIIRLFTKKQKTELEHKESDIHNSIKLIEKEKSENKTKTYSPEEIKKILGD